MSLNQENLQGLTFVQNLANFAYPVNESAAVLNQTSNNALASLTAALGTTTTVQSFIQSLYSGNAVNFPRTWSDFISRLVSFKGTSTGIGTASSGAVFDGFANYHRSLLKTSSSVNQVPGGDWTGLVAASAAASTPINAADLNTQMANLMNDFLASYNTSAPIPGGSQGYIQAFFTQLTIAMSRIGDLTETTFSPASPSTDPDLAAFESVAAAFGLTAADTGPLLAAYYQKVLKETGGGDSAKGYFVPSLAFDGWIQTIFTVSLVGVQGYFNPSTSTAKLLVIDRILLLIIGLVDTIQRVTIAQANRLRFLTQWQSAYTSLLNQIPLATKGDPFNALSVDSDKFANARDAFNQKAENAINIVRARRDQVSDDAKALQANINQSSDAANQQANLASTLLQQMSTILTAIFR